jgi:hypothetical protein
MVRQEHIHIVSAGENIHKAYPAAVRDLQGITHAFIFADTELYTNSACDDERTRTYKTATRSAVTNVKSISASLNIPFSLVYIDPPAFESVKKAILTIGKDHPTARYSFDLSAGSKDLSMALFAISLWVNGDAFYTFGVYKGEVTNTKLAVPKMTAESVAANPNYLTVLRTLYRSQESQAPLVRVLPRSYLFNQLSGFYVPVRKKGVKIVENKTGKTELYTGKRAVLHELSQGTFSNILRTMTKLDLVQERAGGPDNNRKEKFYAITPSGKLAVQLAEIRPWNP